MLAGLRRAATRLPVAPTPPRCCCAAAGQPLRAARRLALAATPRSPRPGSRAAARLAQKQQLPAPALEPETETETETETASLVLDTADDWLSPDEYAKLEVLPLDDTELPKLELQQREQKTRTKDKKSARAAVLEDVKATVESQHGRNARYVIAKMEKAHGGNWTPKKKVLQIAI